MPSEDRDFSASLDALISESKASRDANWEGTMTDYMALVHENPRVAQSAPARVYDMIMQAGTSDIGRPDKLPQL